MSKPETSFINSVHNALDHTIHREKMHNIFRSGTADVWYSARPNDLWIEYKFVELPKRPTTIIDLSLLFSFQQVRWLSQRHYEGRRVYACIGTMWGDRYRGVILGSLAWQQEITGPWLVKTAHFTTAIAAWIRADALNLERPFEAIHDIRLM